jgi:hypothetical protein
MDEISLGLDLAMTYLVVKHLMIISQYKTIHTSFLVPLAEIAADGRDIDGPGLGDDVQVLEQLMINLNNRTIHVLSSCASAETAADGRDIDGPGLGNDVSGGEGFGQRSPL